MAYGQGDKEKLDIFPCTSAKTTSSKAAPVLIFIHGGYWRSLDKADQSFLAPAFTQQGSCVVIPNYSLCPAVTVSDIVLQLVKAVAWVYKNIDKYGGDPEAHHGCRAFSWRAFGGDVVQLFVGKI